MNIFTKNFVTAINYLKLTKVSQAEIARKISIQPQSLSHIMNGKRSPTVENISNLYIIYKVNPIWILTGEGEMFINGGGGELISYKLPESSDKVNENQSGYSQSELLKQKDKEIDRLMGIIEMMIKEGNAGQAVPRERKTG